MELEFVWMEGRDVTAVLSPDGKTVAATGNDVVCFFDVTSGRERRYEQSTKRYLGRLVHAPSIKFSADGSRIAFEWSEGKVRILDVKDGRRVADFPKTRATLS